MRVSPMMSRPLPAGMACGKAAVARYGSACSRAFSIGFGDVDVARQEGFGHGALVVSLMP